MTASPGQPLPRRRQRSSARRFHPEAYLWFGGFFLIALFATHWTYLDLPYFWDEAGQFIPATFDLYRDGQLIPTSATPNVHPPGVMVWISLAWRLVAPAIEVTRGAMLLAAALAMLAAFLLMVELTGNMPGAPALLGIFFLLLSPLAFTQSMMAQLDLPAMGFTALGLYLFLRGRFVASALACTGLVLTKETGALLPGLLLVWLIAERRRAAWLYLIPLAALGGWLWLLHSRTGSWLGSPEFGSYNVDYALQPGRASLALLRRGGFLFFEHGHFLVFTGAAVALLSKRISLKNRSWAVAGAFALAHILLVTLLGGATLERYLLPALPVLYALAGGAFLSLAPTLRLLHILGLTAALLFSLFWNPPWPFPYENNLAMIDFVRLQQETARYLEHNHKEHRIVTAWPLSAALRKPELGYVKEPLQITGRPTFAAADFGDFRGSEFDVFALFSRDWAPRISLLGSYRGRQIARKYLDWRDPIDGKEIEQRLGLKLERSFLLGGHWVEIYARPNPAAPVENRR